MKQLSKNLKKGDQLKKNILIVEDNENTLNALQKEIQKYEGIGAFIASNYRDAIKLLRKERNNIHFAIIDLTLPDANEKQIVALTNSHHLPSIIFTGTSDAKMRDLVFNKEVIDYVLKENRKSVAYAIKRAYQFLKQHQRTLLIVDDSQLYRMAIKNAIAPLSITVMEAENGAEALKMIQNEANNISIAITDFNMPVMDGMELTMKIRALYNRDEFAVIAASTMDDREIIKKFLKIGINDFIFKPFENDEVLVKVQSALEVLDLFQETKDLANKDFLTGAYNRRYFFDVGDAIFAKNKRKKLPIAVAMIDIDHFKRINDIYGHDAGDFALKTVIEVLKDSLRKSDLFARFGGEEFALLLEEITCEDVQKVLEKIRSTFEAQRIVFDDATFSYTVSIGLAFGNFKTLEEALNLSDRALYQAKNNGRNQTVLNQSPNHPHGINVRLMSSEAGCVKEVF